MRYFRSMPILEIGKPKRKVDKTHLKGGKKYPDELVLAIRTAHEIDRKSTRQVERMFPQVSKQYIYNVLNYTIRASIRPKPLLDKP